MEPLNPPGRPTLGAATTALGFILLAAAILVAEPVHAQLRAEENQVFTQADLPQVVSEPGDFFGSSLASGDFNGDGFTDLAVSADFEDVGVEELAGAVNVVYGTAAGLDVPTGQLWLQEDLGLDSTRRHRAWRRGSTPSVGPIDSPANSRHR